MRFGLTRSICVPRNPPHRNDQTSSSGGDSQAQGVDVNAATVYGSTQQVSNQQVVEQVDDASPPQDAPPPSNDDENRELFDLILNKKWSKATTLLEKQEWSTHATRHSKVAILSK